MDLETRLRLRSFARPAVSPLVKAIVITFLFHILFVYYLNSKEEQSVAQIPEWVSIKLIAGIEESKEKKTIKRNAKDIKNHENKLKKNDVLKQQSKDSYNENEIKENKREKRNSQSVVANTLIKANSHPYVHDNPRPVYPAVARRRGMQGLVLLVVEVDVQGYVKSIEVLNSSGFRVLDVAAISSVKKWRFVPGKKDGVNTVSRVEIPVRFSLQKSEY